MKISRLLVLAWALWAGANLACAERITVLAAASLSEALQALAPPFAAATGHTVRFNFGASGALARQIQEGAPADVFISADELRIEQLEKAGRLRAGTRRTLLANTLVVVVGTASEVSVATLADLQKPAIRRIAIGEPATVPAGTYTQEHLQKVGLWRSLSEKCVPLDTVRAVLAAVEAGNAEAGFVYRTDALISRKVRLAYALPREEGPAITYAGAVLQDARQPEVARAFLDWLGQPAAQAVLVKYGFLPVP